MALIVDCYNLLHEPMPPSLAGLDEGQLCKLLATGPWRGGRIAVVCDGNPKPFALSSPVEEVELIYSGQGRSADAVIGEMIDSETAPRRLTVVSSDREIQRAAKRRRCKALSSAEFVKVLAGLRSRGGGTSAGSRRAGPLSDVEVDQWLKRFGVKEDALDSDPDWPWKEAE